MSERLDLDALEATVRRDLAMGPMRSAPISNLDALDLIERLRWAEVRANECAREGFEAEGERDAAEARAWAAENPRP